MAKTLTLLIVCDADPDRPDYGGPSFDVRGPLRWRGLSEGVPRLLEGLVVCRDDAGRGLPILWCVRADEQIERCHDRADWALDHFAALWKDCRSAGHSLGWHPHHWRWNDERRCFHQETADRDWQTHNLEKGAAAFAQPPRFSRTGWYAMNDDNLNTLEKLGVEMDLSAMPGMIRRGEPDRRGSYLVGQYDWSRCKSAPFHPHPRDYQSEDPRGRKLIEYPLRTTASPALRALLGLRYRLRGATGKIGTRLGLNITLHPRLFAPLLEEALREAEARGAARLAVYFHPDELLADAGPRLAGLPLYGAPYLLRNVARLQRLAQRGKIVVRFADAADELAYWQKKLSVDDEPDWQAAPIAATEMERSADLAVQVFHPADAAEYRRRFYWKHGELSQDGPWILAGRQEDRLLGHYPSLAGRAWWFGEEVTSAHSCDTAVLPERQGKGLLGKLAREQYERLRAAGFRFAWAFPNRRIFPLRVGSLAWREVAPFPFLIRPLRLSAVLRRLWPGPLGAFLADGVGAGWNLLSPLPRPSPEVGIAPVGEFGAEADEIWRLARTRLSIATVRDRDWFRRRYVAAPDRPYELFHLKQRGDIVGLAVTRLTEKRDLRTFAVCELFLGDFVLETATAALAALLRHGAEKGAEAAGALCLPHQPEYQAYRRAGFWPLPRRFHPEPTFFTAYPLQGSDDSEALFDAKNWYLTWGDLDTI